MCRSNPEQKGKYIKIILALLQSRSTAVMYECAVTLVSLSSAPTAVRAAANCFCQLLVSHSDNNVKLIVLDRLQVGLGRRPGETRGLSARAGAERSDHRLSRLLPFWSCWAVELLRACWPFPVQL